VLLDTTFLLDLEREARTKRPGPAASFLARHAGRLSVPMVCVGEFYAGCQRFADARRFLARFRRVNLTDLVAMEAGRLDREQRARGARLGENDNWIAATARLRSEAVVSRDTAFDSVRRVRRVNY